MHYDKIVDEQDIEDVDPGLVDHRQGDYKAAPESSQNPYSFRKWVFWAGQTSYWNFAKVFLHEQNK